MKTITKGLSLVAVIAALGGVAHAAQEQRGWGGPDAPDANATVTRAEAQAKAVEMFTRMDANKDGKVDQADRAAMHAAMAGEKFAALDTDKNGTISRQEFLAGRPDRPEGAGMKGPGMEGHEGHKMGKRGDRPGGHDRMGGMMLRMADANKDGAITKDESVAAALKHFDTADANKDGKLTPEERKAAHAKMREQMKSMRGKMGGDMAPPPPPPAN